jgi:predicted transcriptional regulator
MDKEKQAKLEAAGWVVGTPKVALAATLRERRVGQHLSQVEAAKRLHSSQSRVAKMELADKTVTVDLLIRSILGLGGTREMVAAAISR